MNIETVDVEVQCPTCGRINVYRLVTDLGLAWIAVPCQYCKEEVAVCVSGN